MHTFRLSTAAAPKETPKSSSSLLRNTAILVGLCGAGYYAYGESIKNTKAEAFKVMQARAKLQPKAALKSDEDKFVSFQLEDVTPVTHNTNRFRFALPEGTTELGLPTASCLLAKFVKGKTDDGKDDVVIRPYTPVEDPSGYTGTFDLIVKKYPS